MIKCIICGILTSNKRCCSRRCYFEARKRKLLVAGHFAKGYKPHNKGTGKVYIKKCLFLCNALVA